MTKLVIPFFIIIKGNLKMAKENVSKMAKEENVITQAVEFLRKLRGSKESIVKFKKKDGSDRVMRCTLDFKEIPKTNHPKNPVSVDDILERLQKHELIRVFDIEKQDWRSVPFNRAEWIEVNNVRFSIKR